MKIIIYSHPPYTQTGFGTVVKNLVHHWKNKHELYLVPVINHVGNSINVDGVSILSCPGSLEHSAHWIAKWSRDLKADIILQHFDVWMLPENWIKECYCPVLTYAPVDCEPLPLNFVESVKGAHTNIAMSRHAERLFKEADLPTEFIPHGVDLNVFFRRPDARKFLGLPEKAFIVGIVATNGSIRKNLGGQILAFKHFAEKHEDAILYIHTQYLKTHAEAMDLGKFVARYNIVDKVIFTDPEMYALGISEEILSHIYSSFDVLLQCSLGEGFGLPIIEAQAHDVPVIGTNCSAIPSVIGNGGYVVDGTKLLMPYYMSNVTVPFTEEIADALEIFYQQDRKFRITQARLNVIKYDWKKIFPLWDKLIESI